MSGTGTGSTCRTGTSCRCPTAGSTPGTRRGTWPSTACRSAWSIPRSPGSRSSSSSATCTCTRAGRSPPTSGTSATSTRPCTPVAQPCRRAVRVHGARAGVPGAVPARRVRHCHVRRQLQLARPGLVPINLLIVRALLTYYLYYGDDFTIECPTGSGRQMTLFEVAKDISDRLISIFRRDETGRRPVYGGMATFQDDPHWRDLLLFHEYFHGDNGAGIGASHQTGWTGAVARLIQLFGST